MTNDELIAALKALPKAKAARMLRLAHGYSCVWDDDDGEATDTPGTLVEYHGLPPGEIMSGSYAIGFEKVHVLVTGDGIDDWEDFSTREEAEQYWDELPERGAAK